MGVTYIMWLREVKKYWRSKARIIGSLGQPLLFLFALGFGLGSAFQQAGGGSFIQYLVPGIVAMSILFTGMFAGIAVIWDRQFGFLKETLVAPVSRFKLMAGRTLGGATVAFLQGLIVFIISLFLGINLNPVMVPLAFLFMILIGLVFTALGTVIASRMEDMQAFPLVINFLIMPLFFLSGALFPLKNLPGWLHIITIINPLSYGVDGVRFAMTGVSSLGIWVDFGVTAGLAILMMIIGSYFFNKIQI